MTACAKASASVTDGRHRCMRLGVLPNPMLTSSGLLSCSASGQGRSEGSMLLRGMRCQSTASIRRPLWGWQHAAGFGGGGGGDGSSDLLPAGAASATAKAKRGRPAKQASPIEAEESDAATAEAGSVAATQAAADSFVDLAQYAPQGPLWDPAALPERWLAFSDLHVSHKTRATCLAVLEEVHEQAAARGAGILFLGDFWHTRGTLPVEPLNEVVTELAGWQQPTLMLPGNHDQVSLGGEVHALTPLAAANLTIHAFDGPALFLGALWLPYRRDRSKLEAALAAAAANPAAAAAAAAAGGVGAGGHGDDGGSGPLQAVFAHTDILGALMNEAYQAHDGLPPDIFPPHIPTYTGHYHKPHTVPGSRITYIGSPYQVTRAEAGQHKRLLLLDRSAGWEVAEELPLDLGPRYFSAAAVPAVVDAAVAAEEALAEAAGEGGTAASLSDASSDAEGALQSAEAASAASGAAAEAAAAAFELHLPADLRRGDRLLLTLSAGAAKQHQKRLKKLEKQGIEIEVFTPPEAAAAPRIGATEGMGPLQLWQRYSDWQRLPEASAAAGARLLQHLLEGGGSSSGALEGRHISIQFQAVEVEGYFSFRDPVRYDLAQRGLVVVTGQVQDTAEAGVESNGAGKTALMMAPLWALTGNVDSRAEGSSSVRPLLADIINDDSKRARVRVEGLVNGAPFVVERTANKKSSSVTFQLDGEDLTTQENRLTQERIDTQLGAELLGRTVFYGQSDITALLEASDRAFKQELSKVVDLEVWAQAKEASRAELSSRREALREAAAALRERQQQAGALEQQLEGLQQQAADWEGQQAAAAGLLQQEAGQLLLQLRAQQRAAGAALELGQAAGADVAGEAAELEQQLQQLQAALEERRRDLKASSSGSGASSGGLGMEEAEQRLAEQQQRQQDAAEEQQRRQFELGASAAAAADAQRRFGEAREQTAVAAEALEAFLSKHLGLGSADAISEAGSSSNSGGRGGNPTAEAQLEELLQQERQRREEFDRAVNLLTAAQVEVAAQESRLTAKREAAQQAQQEADLARAALQGLQLEVEAAFEDSEAAPLLLELAEAKRQLKYVQRRLAGAQQRLGAAQGQARERRQQLRQYLQLSDGISSVAAGSDSTTSSTGSSICSSGGDAEEAREAGNGGGGGGGNVVVVQQEEEQHEHVDGTVCDRCHQPISQELFRQNVARLETAAEAAEQGAAQAERQVEQLSQAAEEAEAAVVAAEQREERQTAIAAAAQVAVGREADAEAAAGEAAKAEARLAELSTAVAQAEAAVEEQAAAGERLASAIDAAEGLAALEGQRRQLLGAASGAAVAQEEAALRLQQTEEQQREAEAALGQAEAAAAEAAAAVASAQQQLQEVSQHADRVARLEQQHVLLHGQQAALQQRQRLLQAQLDSLAELAGARLAAAAAELEHACGSMHSTESGSNCSSSDGLSGGEEHEASAVAAMAAADAEAALEAAAAAARSCLAAASDLQQRWSWHRQQPNLPARDAALVRQQLAAAAGQVEEIERRQQELEAESAVWKQVDNAFLPRGVVNFVVEGVLGDLQAATSRNLSALTSGMSLVLSPCKPSKNKGDVEGVIEQIEKIVHVRQPGSLEMRARSVRQLSGGERRRVALALALGFSELAAQRGRLRSNLVVMDEVMQHLDGEGCLRVAQLLKQLPYDSILVVAQAHSLLTQAFDAADVVLKQGGRSTVEQGSSAAVS